LSEKGGGGVKIPAGIKTPEGITMAKYRRESFIPAGIKTPVGVTMANTGGNHDGPAGLDAISTGMPAESRRFYVHRGSLSAWLMFIVIIGTKRIKLRLI
jgi:hypothetical protein